MRFQGKNLCWLGILAALLVFAGCSGSKKADTSGSGYTKLTMAFFSGAKLEDLKLVQEEMNKITREKAGAEITLLPIDWSAWDQQINLMISGNEKLDIIPILGENYTNGVGQGKLIALDEYLNSSLGRQMVKTVGDTYVSASRINGKIYGFPSLRDMANSFGLLMRKDLVEKYHIDVNAIKTLDDIDRVFATVKAGEPDMYMVYSPGVQHGLVFQLFNDRDSLADDLGVLLNMGQDNLKVENLYASDVYAKYVRKIHEWYLKGYIPRDALTTTNDGNTMMRNNQLFAQGAKLKPGYAAEAGMSMEFDLVQVDIIPPFANTYTITSVMLGIPITCKEPQKAVDVLSLLYTDPDFINLIDWGIEGKHYVKIPGYDNMITFPQGINFDNSRWDMNAGWIFGNQLASYIWEGNSPDLYAELDSFNKNALNSKAMGFRYDSTSVKTAVAAVNNVIEEYRLGLEFGVVDPEVNLPRFIQALKNAGIDEIVAEKQRQLDAWAAVNAK